MNIKEFDRISIKRAENGFVIESTGLGDDGFFRDKSIVEKSPAALLKRVATVLGLEVGSITKAKAPAKKRARSR